MRETIEKFYKAFAELDAESMVACYHKDVVFHDPAFGELKGERARNMWRMLCESQKDKNFIVKYSNIKFNENHGSAEWEAFYSFGKSQRRVHNIIQGRFEIVDGKICRHIDEFNFHKWAGQALGPMGYLLGWTAFLRNSFQKKAGSLLDKFESRQT